MDPIIIPFTFGAILAIVGLAIIMFDAWERRRQRNESK